MRKIFCANQQKSLGYDNETVKIYCAIYGKECPYTKYSKAAKKCSEAYFIPEQDINDDDLRGE